MSQRRKRKFMVSIATGRVLGRSIERAAIGSPAALRRACEDELAMYGKEIAAEADRLVALERQTVRSVVAGVIQQHRPCAECGGPIEGAQRSSRWFCSNRCRQSAHRKRQRQTLSELLAQCDPTAAPAAEYPRQFRVASEHPDPDADALLDQLNADCDHA